MLGDQSHDGEVNDFAPKTEWYPDEGIPENLEGYVTNDRAHRYAECSNAGICDRTTGVCQCFNGFEGSSCQRKTCPSNTNGVCSGHGSCISSSIALQYISGGGTTLSGWEYDKFYTCMCDEGWKNMDCSARICPKGLNPSAGTPPNFEYTYKLPIQEYDNDKTIKITPSHFFRYKFNNHVYTSPSVGAKLAPTKDATDSNSKISEIQEEIRKTIAVIPPLSQSRVVITSSDNTYVSPLTVHIYADYIDYDLFYNDKNSYLHVYFNKNEPKEAEKVSDTLPKDSKGEDIKRDPTECSSKGICNTESGLCECMTGYYGIACQLAT